MTKLRRLAAIFATCAALVGAAAAGDITADERSELSRITEKLATIDSMNGEFVQFGPNGGRAGGKFYLQKPGKMRFQYNPPVKLSIVSNGKDILFHDTKLQTYDIWPLKQTPLRFLLSKNLNLAATEQVTDVIIEDDLTQVELIDDSRFGGGSLKLLFDRDTLDLRQWTITDRQGLDTSVAVYNVETDNRFPRNTFHIDYSAATQARRERAQNN